MKFEKINRWTQHLFHPLTAKSSEGEDIPIQKGKVKTIALSILIGAVTFGVGGVAYFYHSTAKKKIELLKDLETQKTAAKTENTATIITDLPNELLMHIGGFLPDQDLANLAKADERLKTPAAQAIIDRAKRYGYGFEGEEITAQGAKQYLKRLDRALICMNLMGKIPKSKLVKTEGRNWMLYFYPASARKIDRDETLKNMETLSREDIDTILSWGPVDAHAYHRYKEDFSVLFRFLRTRKIDEMDIGDSRRIGSILLHAIKLRDLETVQFLMQIGLDPSAPYWFEDFNRFDYPLMIADAEISKILIDYGADVNEQDGATTVLSKAVKNGDRAKVELLLENGADPFQGPILMVHAIYHRRHDILELLLDYGAPTKRPDYVGPLLAAMSVNDQKSIDLLLEHENGINIEEDDGSALRQAIGEKDLKYARKFLEIGADVDRIYYGKTPLTWAARTQRLDLIKFLLTYGADPDKSDGTNTPLHNAVITGRLEIVKALVDRRKGAQVDKENEQGWTPLYQAAGNRRFEIAQYLLEKGADPNKESEGYCPIHQAAKNGKPKDIEFAKKMKVYGADLNKTSEAGTPLMIAASANNLKMLQFLLENGANPDIGVNGYAPLHLALRKGHTRIVRALLENGADPNLPNQEGETPLDYAIARKDSRLIKLIRDKGGQSSS